MFITLASKALPSDGQVYVFDDFALPAVPRLIASRLKACDGFVVRPGQVVQNLLIRGSLDCRNAKGAIIRRCLIDGGRKPGSKGSTYGVRTDGCPGDVRVESCEIRNVASCAIYGDHFQAIGNLVHHCGGDGFKPGNNCLIQGNTVRLLGYLSPKAHSDGVQIRGGSNVRIIGNFFDMPDAAGFKSNSPIFIQGKDGTPARDILIQRNLVRGGQYCMRPRSDGSAADARTLRCIQNVCWDWRSNWISGDEGAIRQGNVDRLGKPLS